MGIPDGFYGHPTNGKAARLGAYVDQILLFIRGTVEAKVSNLDHFVCRQKEISAGYVAMHHSDACQMLLMEGETQNSL